MVLSSGNKLFLFKVCREKKIYCKGGLHELRGKSISEMKHGVVISVVFEQPKKAIFAQPMA